MTEVSRPSDLGNFRRRLGGILPPWHPNHKAWVERMKRLAEMDLGFRAQFRETKERLPAYMHARMHGGSGFRLSETLRWFLQEYTWRLIQNGPYSLPTSFNVVEAFLLLSEDFAIFDLRPEREHLLRSFDYVDWYTSGSMPDAPGALRDVMAEATIYTYEFVDAVADFQLKAEASTFVPFGVSLVRHGDFLSVLALVGEKPPKEFELDKTNMTRTRGHEAVEPDPELTADDRYVEGNPEFGRIFVLTRIDLQRRAYDVRCVEVDIGRSFIVFTDDLNALAGSADGLAFERLLIAQRDGLTAYTQLIAAVTSLIYLPMFFIAEASRVEEVRFATRLQQTKDSAEVQDAIHRFGTKAIPFYRRIDCLVGPKAGDGIASRRLEAPRLELAKAGYWRILSPGQIGKDEVGNPIVGRTWVKRVETWLDQTPGSFLVSAGQERVSGSDPGFLYVARSAGHEQDLFKIGLTRRPTDVRASELSQATGVPLPFGVLAHWAVGDCVAAERRVHEALQSHRVSPSREFFQASLPEIVRTIERTLDEPPVATEVPG